jgi:hypothetical protein
MNSWPISANRLIKLSRPITASRLTVVANNAFRNGRHQPRNPAERANQSKGIEMQTTVTCDSQQFIGH